MKKLTLQKVLENLLEQALNNVGNSNLSEEESEELIDLLQRVNSEELSKIEACNYINVSRATFDKYVSEGLLPKGKKRQGWKELRWYKCDLDKYLEK